MATKSRDARKFSSSSHNDSSVSAGTITRGVPSSGGEVIRWVEIGLFIVMLVGAIILHVIVFLHSGALWRDEIGTLNTSMIPHVHDLWDTMQFEAFPILWFLILRGWVSLGFGETDLALRVLGLIVGLGIVGALWFAGRTLKIRFPLVSLVLFALCPTVLWGDSLRAYGLGVILILLTLGSLLRAMEDPVPRKMLISLVTAVLSVQCLYHNAFLLFALCVGGSAVGLYRRRWKLILFSLGIGAIAALSVLPYYTIVTKTWAWNAIVKDPITLPWIIGKLRHAIDPTGLFLAWFWLVLALLTVFVFVRALLAPSRDRSEEQKGPIVFLLAAMPVGIVSYVTFIKLLSYPTQIWYYLPLMAVFALIMDKGVDMVCEENAVGRWARVLCIAMAAVVIIAGSWNAAHVRKSNVDLLAEKLESIAGKDDLIVVFPFHYGISFAHYYRGATRWVTLPAIEDHSVHRYDLLKSRMMQSEPLQPVIASMLEKLREGKRVWLVGSLDFLKQGEVPWDIAPAPNSPYGWNEDVYQMVWSRKAAFALQIHMQTLRRVRVPAPGPVCVFENAPLFVAQGWRS